MLDHSQSLEYRPTFLWFLSLSFLDRTIRSVVEQHLFSVNPVGSRSSEERQLTPCPPPASVTPTARQRRRHQREKREEELTQRDRNRWDEISVVMFLEVDGTGMKRLTLCSLLKNYAGLVKCSKVKQCLKYKQELWTFLQDISVTLM